VCGGFVRTSGQRLEIHEIQALSQVYGTEGIPASPIWTTAEGITREKIDFEISKEGKGVVLSVSPKTGPDFRLASFSARYRVQLTKNWSVVFGTSKTPTDMELTQIMINISAPWDEAAKRHRRPWQIYLSVQQWRASEWGDIVVIVSEAFSDEKSPRENNKYVLNVQPFPNYSLTSRARKSFGPYSDLAGILIGRSRSRLPQPLTARVQSLRHTPSNGRAVTRPQLGSGTLLQQQHWQMDLVRFHVRVE
jgi:hypothetical protein